jgi:hypothetical protein
VSAAKQLALMAGIPVKKHADGTEYVEVSKATGKYLFGEPVTRWDVTEMVREAKRALKPAYVDEEPA